MGSGEFVVTHSWALGDGEKDRMVLISIFCSSANLLVIAWDD
jgi:hypothetical protein